MKMFRFLGVVIRLICFTGCMVLYTSLSAQDYSFPVKDWSSIYCPPGNDSGVINTIIPRRGTIYDRHHKVMAMDSILYDLIVIPSKVQKTDTTLICRLLKISRFEFRDRLKAALRLVNPRFPEIRDADKPGIFAKLLEKSLAGKLLAKADSLPPAFFLAKHVFRYYPLNTGGMTLGVIGPVKQKDLTTLAGSGYLLGDMKGESGLEYTYDSLLTGRLGRAYHYCSAKPPMRTRSLPSVAGTDLYTSLDRALQQLGERLMKGKKGAIVAIEPATGEMLAMVSAPEINLQRYATDKNKYLDEIQNNKIVASWTNKAIHGTYPPGSTFKVFQAMEALRFNVISPEEIYRCTGFYSDCGHKPACHATAPHAVDLDKAIALSCNSYFADLFRKMVGPKPDSGLAVWSKGIQRWGFSLTTGIDLPGEKTGNIPQSKPGMTSSCNIISNSIGQGEISVTVLQMASALCGIANDGWFITPHIAKGFSNAAFNTMLPKVDTNRINTSPESLIAVRQGMWSAVQDSMGTAFVSRLSGIPYCGKTGTAENASGKDHAWFAAFAPAINPKIAIVCMIEEGGFGATAAAPLVRQMIAAYVRSVPSK